MAWAHFARGNRASQRRGDRDHTIGVPLFDARNIRLTFAEGTQLIPGGQERCLGRTHVALSVYQVGLGLLPIFQRSGFLAIQLVLPLFVMVRQTQGVLGFC